MTNPLFVADLATLKASLRLTNVPSTSGDALAILDECILKARLSFYRRLGEQRVGVLVGYTYDPNPASKEQILRALANVVEVKLTYVELLRRLPNQFMDASGDANRRWDEEAPFRERGPTAAEKEISRLLDEIEEDMEMLNAEEGLGDEVQYKVFDGTPTFIPPRPGDSMRTFRRFGRCNSED